MDTWQAVDEERSALADDLATLDDSQWDTQSLCSEWKVRHVVGHLIGGADVKMGPFLAGMLKSGMNFNRCMAREGLALGAVPPDELLEQFRKTIGTRRTPPGANPEIMLTDLVCHSGDIRRPTGMTRSVPEATLVTVADTVKRVGFPTPRQEAHRRSAPVGHRLRLVGGRRSFRRGPAGLAHLRHGGTEGTARGPVGRRNANPPVPHVTAVPRRLGSRQSASRHAPSASA